MSHRLSLPTVVVIRRRTNAPHSFHLFPLFLLLVLLGGFVWARDAALHASGVQAPTAAELGSAVAPVSVNQSAPAGIDPDAPQRVGTRMVWLPGVASPEGGADCDVEVSVQNVGHEASKAALIAWGEPSACPPMADGPLKVECSGLLRPGGSWTFSDAQIPEGTRSLLAVSFTASQLSRLGIDIDFDDIVADYMCETLFFGVVGDFADYAQFMTALRSGDEFAGLPLERVIGAPLAVTLQRGCPHPDDPGLVRMSAVPGVFEADLGMAGAQGGYHYALPLAHAAAVTTTGTALHIQNAGAECASVELAFRAEGGAAPSLCMLEVLALAPGEAVHMNLSTCAADGDLEGGLTLRGSQPLAVSADLRWGESMLSLLGQPFQPTEEGGAASDVPPATDFHAPVVYHDMLGWTSRIHVQNLDDDRPATVGFELAGRGGSPRGSGFAVEVPPSASRMIDLGEEVEGRDIPGNMVGSLRVRSKAAAPDGGPPPGIAVVVAGYRNMSDTGPSEAMGYVPSYLPPSAVGPRFRSMRGGLLAVPSLVKARESGGATTEIALANSATAPGDTNLVLFIADQNGLLDYVCLKLGPLSVDYIDLDNWGVINGGFRGSAIVSATSWSTTGAGSDSSAALTAILISRPDGPAADEPGDSAFSHAAISIPASAQVRTIHGFGPGDGAICGLQADPRTPTPWPTIVPPPTATSRPGQATPTSPPLTDRTKRAYLPRLVR